MRCSESTGSVSFQRAGSWLRTANFEPGALITRMTSSRCFKCEDYRVGIESGEYLEYCLHPVTDNIGLTDDDGNAILESCGTTGNCYTAIKDKFIQNSLFNLRPPDSL